jgi:23S rRNA (cytosine1962-C5)-methyltransferase
MQLRFVVPASPAAEAVRLLEIAQLALPEVSERALPTLIDEATVLVNGRRVRDSRRGLAAGDVVEIRLDGAPEPEADEGSEPIELERGAGWVVVDRPVGMAATIPHDDPLHPMLFMADGLGYDRDTVSAAWPMPIHTSGPWLIAPDVAGAAELAREVIDGTIDTFWTALVPRLPMPQGVMESAAGLVVSYSVSRFRGGLCEVLLHPEQWGAVDPASFDPFALLGELLADQDAAALGDRERGGYMCGPLALRLCILQHDGRGMGHSWNPPKGWWPHGAVVPAPPEEPAAPMDHGADPAALPPGTRTAEPAFGDRPRDTREQHQPREEAAPELITRGPRAHSDAPAARNATWLQVSDKTLEILEAGHFWVLADSQTGPRHHLAPGDLIRLKGASGKVGPWAIVEGAGELVARVWARSEDEASLSSDEVLGRLDRAMLTRAELLRDPETTLFRLVHGEADGLPGFTLDRVGTLWRATLRGQCAVAFKERIYTSLMDFDPGAVILEVAHTRDVREEGGELPRARLVRQGRGFVKRDARVIGAEHGLRYWCEPWEGMDVGFFADQRGNRERLVAHAAPGQRWLNLFAHTGAFAVALAERGAQVTQVDVSRHYLRWSQENFELNKLDASLLVNVEADARRFMEQAQEPFDGIIVDPPTAARGKDGFWSVRRDFEPLLDQCGRALKPGGHMLVCRNDRRQRPELATLVRESAKRLGRKVMALEVVAPGVDYPGAAGFPEGDTFEGVLVQLG